MPKLNLQTLPTVAQQQGPTPQFHLDSRGAFGEEVAGAVSASVGLLAKHAIEAKQSADVAAVEEAETHLERRLQRRLYGGQDEDGQEQPGFLASQGHNTLEGSAELLKQIQQDQQDVLEGLTDEGQRRAFKRRTDGSVLMAQRHVETHVGAQRQVVEGQAFAGRRAAALDAIANGYNLPEVVSRERQNLEPLLMQEAKRLGLEGAGAYPPAEGTPAAALLGSWRKDVAKTVLDRFLADKDAPRARAFLAQPMTAGGPSAQEVLGGEADKYVAKINAVGDLDEAYTTAQGIVDSLKDPDTGKVDEGAAREQVKQLPPARQREARAMLESLLGHEREGFRRNVDDVWNRAKAAYLSGPGGRAGLQRVDGGEAGWLVINAPDAWRALQTWADQDDAERTNKAPTPAQDSAFSAIATAIVDDPGKFITLTGPQFEQQYLSQVAPRDRKALLGHFLGAKGQARKPDETLPGNVMAEILELGRGAGVFQKKGDPRTWAPERAAAHAQMVRDLLNVQAERKAAGQPPLKPEEWTKEIQKRLRPGVVKGGGRLFGDRSGVTELEARTHPDFEGKEWQEEIPEAFRKEAEAELQRDPTASFPVTEGNIRYLFDLQQGRNPARPESMRPYNREELQRDAPLRVGTLTP